jgi:hypothetical protein
MLTFRIDDVSPNTDFPKLNKMRKLLCDSFTGIDIWYCCNIFSKRFEDVFSNYGSVYPNPPFKHMETKKFYGVDSLLDNKHDLERLGNVRIVSHGLFHADHSKLQYDAQEMSIAGSCAYLETDIFVPPFNNFNQSTEAVCRHHNIKLVRSYDEGWRSLEFEKFTTSHKLWYFHPWRFSIEEFRKAINC